MVQWHWNQIESGGAKLIRNLESCQAKKNIKRKKKRKKDNGYGYTCVFVKR